MHAGSFQQRIVHQDRVRLSAGDCNTDPGVPRDEPGAGDIWYAEWLMIERPEQSKYTANLLVFHKNNKLPQDSYVFVPALRRSPRLTVSARCAAGAGQ